MSNVDLTKRMCISSERKLICMSHTVYFYLALKDFESGSAHLCYTYMQLRFSVFGMMYLYIDVYESSKYKI